MELSCKDTLSPSCEISNGSSSSSSSGNNSTSHHGSSSLRDLDELLMGSNDLDALPFEFGCDFGAAFEDKYIVPPLSTTSSSRLAAIAAESGFDTLPPLSLLSPLPGHFHLNMPLPSPFRHFDYDRLKAASRCSNSNSSNASDSHVQSTPSSIASSSSPLKDDAGASASASASDASVTPATTVLARSGAKPTHIGRWTKKEHELFLEGLKLFGKSWKKISSLVVTRTLVQIRTHAQKYLQKQAKNAQKAAAAAAATAAADAESAVTPSSKSMRLPTSQHFGEHMDAWRGASASFSDLLPQPPPTTSTAMPAFGRLVLSPSYVLPAIVKREAGSNSMCRLDQLLQDESPHGAMVDGYYSSPMSTDDDVLQQPVYVQWPPRSESLSTSSSSILSLPTKRRRLESLAVGQQLHPLVNPMDAMVSSAGADGHAMSMYALGPHGAGASVTSSHLYGAMDYSHHQHQHSQSQQHHAYVAPSTVFADSSNSSEFSEYNGWQSLPQL